jgi:predicted dehydrogenase
MIKVVVVGFGFMGKTHTGNLLKNPNAKLVAIVDKSTENIQKNLKEESGNFSTDSFSEEELFKVNVYADFDECLKTEKPDACIIAVHTNLHYEMAKLALDSGCHVFLEKPFCLDVAGGKELIKLAHAKNKILMIGHVLRFMQAYLTLKNWIESEEFGKLEFLSLSRFSGVPAWGQWKEKQKDFGSSGGALFDLVIHDIDFAQWVCGNPDEISAICLPGKLSKHDYVSALWNYRNKNLQVKIEGGNTFHTAYPFHAGYSARFENASVLYYPKDPQNIIVTTETETTLVPAGDANDGFSEELDYFILCIKKNKQPDMCTPESALESIEICYRHTVDTE